MPPPEPGAPGIFSMADPDRIRELVTGAGFEDPRIEDVELAFSFDGLDDYWRFMTEMSAGLAQVIAELPEEEQLEIRALYGERIASFRQDGAYRMPGVTLCVSTS
jgi:hypothetical protein